MAYIRKRGKSWSYTVDIGRDPATGERRQHTKSGFRTKKEAEIAASRAETELADGTFVKESGITFRQFAESWLEFYSSTGTVKPGSINVRRTRLNKLLKYFGAARLADISRLNYQNMLLDMKKQGLANETILSTHATAKMIFRYALEMEVLKSDPTRYSKVPRKQKTVEEIEEGTELPRFMEKSDLVNFLSIAQREGRDKDYAVFMVLAYTGIRIGELIALKWKDIDLENKTISITKTYHNVRNNTKAYELVPPKTEASIRIIEFDHVLKAIFEEHKTLRNIYKMRYRNRFYEEDFVFPNLGPKFPGYPDVQKNIEMRMARLVEMAGLNQEFTPHSFRHTHTTLLAEAGASLQEIMERLGHKDDKTTRDVYLHVTKEMKRGAAEKFSNFMANVVRM
jgi:integrase